VTNEVVRLRVDETHIEFAKLLRRISIHYFINRSCFPTYTGSTRCLEVALYLDVLYVVVTIVFHRKVDQQYVVEPATLANKLKGVQFLWASELGEKHWTAYQLAFVNPARSSKLSYLEG
jgi:hypothetical protein